MPPLPDEHRVATLEVRHDKCGIGVGDHRVDRFSAIWETDHVVAQLEVARPAAHRRGGDLKRSPALGMPEPAYRCTIVATAAAAAARWRGSGP